MITRTITVTSRAEGDVIDLTAEVKSAVQEHSTAALTTIEFEPGVLRDLKRALSVLAPDNADYAHNTRWGDGNGRSHVKAALVGPSLTIPVGNGSLMCGTWQQIVLLELDVNAGRERTIVCTITGE
jgi:secondary thiamine-phosphate synthase enzyme